MANPFAGQPEHSAEYFGDTRDHWWNADFLALVARRLRLDTARSVLDVGCGIGHWGALLASVMPAGTHVVGVDREPRWVAVARERAASRPLGTRYSYLRGGAERLAFADDSFDFVTCQTLLIHLADPAAALAEMVRVTKPGGLVLAAEPNNMSAALSLDSVAVAASVDEILDLTRLQLVCERGKVALGEGDNSLGDRVPGLFADQGLDDVAVYANDKVVALFPPYQAQDQRAHVEEERYRLAQRLGFWSEAESRRYFLAGGGRKEDFDRLFMLALERLAKIVRAIDDGTYRATAGGAFYLVAGRKSPARARIRGGPGGHHRAC